MKNPTCYHLIIQICHQHSLLTNLPFLQNKTMPRGPVSKNKQFPELVVASQFNSPEIVFQRWPPSLQLIKPQAYLSEVLWVGLRWNMWKHDRKPLFPLPNIRLSCFSLQPILSNSGISLFVTKIAIGFMADISAIFHWWGCQLRSSKYASNGTRRVYRSAFVHAESKSQKHHESNINLCKMIYVYIRKKALWVVETCAQLCACVLGQMLPRARLPNSAPMWSLQL